MVVFLSYLLNPAAFYEKFLVIFTVFILFYVGDKFKIYNINVKSKADTILHLLHPIIKINKSVKSKFGRIFFN